MTRFEFRGWRGFLISAAVLASGTQALAFQLGDHEAVTRTAVQEFNRCFPGSIPKADEDALVAADRDEDTNVFLKWTLYSHYYNPEKKLDMRRYDSSERVHDLAEYLGTGSGSRLANLGHLVHHLQDMAAPPHVVPVNHWLTDGFESLGTGIAASAVSLKEDCARSLVYSGFEDLLKGVAEATLKRVRTESLAVRRNGSAYGIGWWAFWAESKDDSFGSYGYFGNRFGDVVIDTPDGRYEVPASLYRRFKEEQLRSAVDATKKAFHIVFQKKP